MPFYYDDYDRLDMQLPDYMLELIQNSEELPDATAELILEEDGTITIEVFSLDPSKDTVVLVNIPYAMSDQIYASLQFYGFNVNIFDLRVYIDKKSIKKGIVKFLNPEMENYDLIVPITFTLKANIWAEFISQMEFGEL